MRSKKKGIIFRAGIRSGKSKVACIKAVRNALQKRTQLIVSFSYRTLKDTILITLRKTLEEHGLKEYEHYTINLTDMIVVLMGTYIFLRSGDSPDALRGLEVADVFIDEARQFKADDIFLICIGRMSECEDGQWHLISSPKGKNWVYALEVSDDPTIEIIHQKTSENAFLPKGYEEDLRKRYFTKFAQQELDGDIVVIGAGTIQEAWFRIIKPVRFTQAVRAWDLAVSIKLSADYSVGALSQWVGDTFVIGNIFRAKLEFPELRKRIIETAKSDGISTIIVIEASGQQQGFIDELKRDPELRNYVIKAVRPEGDKLNRAIPWITRAELGKVALVEGPWNRVFLDECNEFTTDMSHDHDDQCFIAGTMISTPYGDRPIETLRIGDWVITPFGIKKVENIVNHKVDKVITNIGLTGTGNHPIISKGDNLTIRLDAVNILYYKSTVFLITLKEQLRWVVARALFMMDSNFLDSEKDISTIKKLSTKKGILLHYIGTFGKNIIKLRYQRVISSIILMGIDLIMSTAIYSCYTVCNITRYLSVNAQMHKKNILRVSDILQNLGMHQKRVESSTVNSQKSHGQKATLKKQKLNALNVIKSFYHLGPILHVVVDIVIKNTIIKYWLLVKYLCALFAEKNLLQQQSTVCQERHVEKNVMSFIGQIQNLKNDIVVYNLKVEEAHMYYANHILVHNCDAVSLSYQVASTYTEVRASRERF